MMFGLPIYITDTANDWMDYALLAAAFTQALGSILAIIWTSKLAREDRQHERSALIENHNDLVAALRTAVEEGLKPFRGLRDAITKSEIETALQDVSSSHFTLLTAYLDMPVSQWPSGTMYSSAWRLRQAAEEYRHASWAALTSDDMTASTARAVKQMQLSTAEMDFDTASIRALRD